MLPGGQQATDTIGKVRFKDRAEQNVQFASLFRTYNYYSKGMDERIVIDPNICNGRPTVRGTRITAQTILEFLAAGDSVEDVIEEYPTLTREDILACLAYSSRLLTHRFSLEKIV